MSSRSAKQNNDLPSFNSSSSDPFGASGQDPFGSMPDPFAPPQEDAGGPAGDSFGGTNPSPFTFSGNEGMNGGEDGWRDPSSHGGSGNSGGSGRGPGPILIGIAIAAAVLLLTVVLVMSASSGAPVQTFSIEQDTGEISASVTDLSDGNYHVRLSHTLTQLDPSQIYVAGFMMAPENQGLTAINEPDYIAKTDHYTASAEIIITQPGRYQLAFYSYSFTNPVPVITRTQIIEIGSGTSQTIPSDETAIILITPSPSPTPSPTPTPTPTPQLQALVTEDPRKNVPSSDLFGLYDADTRFYYNQLTDTQKKIFSQMYDGVAAGMSDIPLTPCAEEDFLHALDVLKYDCPELFFWDYEDDPRTYTRNALHQVIAFNPSVYAYSVSEYRTKLEQVLAEIRAMSSLPGFGQSDFSKQEAIYDYIIRESTYNKTLPYCAYADSVYLYGYSKCTGYAYALNLALRYYGIPCAVVMGDTLDNGVFAPESHMWSVAKIDGAWYQCDATWDDNDETPISHAYLNLNDKLMLAERVLLSKHEKLLLPDCTSLAANAMMSEGVYIPAGTNVEDRLLSELVEALTSGKGRVQLLFESSADCATALILLQSDDFGNKLFSRAESGYSTSYFYHTDVNYIDISIMP